MRPQIICLRCPHRLLTDDGTAPCMLDPHRRDIHVMVKLPLAELPAACPQPELRTDEPLPAYAPAKRFAPGNAAEALIHWLGYEPRSTCSCRRFQAQMNAWGWLGCLWHAPQILLHFRREYINRSS